MQGSSFGTRSMLSAAITVSTGTLIDVKQIREMVGTLGGLSLNVVGGFGYTTNATDIGLILGRSIGEGRSSAGFMVNSHESAHAIAESLRSLNEKKRMGFNEEKTPKVLRVPTASPSVKDIDAIYDDVTLTDAEERDVELLRASKLARPTIPLVRFPRS